MSRFLAAGVFFSLWLLAIGAKAVYLVYLPEEERDIERGICLSYGNWFRYCQFHDVLTHLRQQQHRFEHQPNRGDLGISNAGVTGAVVQRYIGRQI